MIHNLFKIIFSWKTSSNKPSSTDVNFIFDSHVYRQVLRDKGLLSSAIILHIARRCCLSSCLLAVLAMFLANSSLISSSWNEWNVPPFCTHYQNNSTSSSNASSVPMRVFSVNCSVFNSVNYATQSMSFFNILHKKKCFLPHPSRTLYSFITIDKCQSDCVLFWFSWLR